VKNIYRPIGEAKFARFSVNKLATTTPPSPNKKTISIHFVTVALKVQLHCITTLLYHVKITRVKVKKQKLY